MRGTASAGLASSCSRPPGGPYEGKNRENMVSNYTCLASLVGYSMGRAVNMELDRRMIRSGDDVTAARVVERGCDVVDREDKG